MSDFAYVKIWGKAVGVVVWDKDKGIAHFEYDERFIKLGLDISPIHMSIDNARRGEKIFSFPQLKTVTFKGLPGLLADTLPDKFGNAIIDAWLARQGQSITDFTPVNRLCYTGSRGMGALEFKPTDKNNLDKTVDVEISQLVQLAQEVSQTREHLNTNINESNDNNSEAIKDIIRVGTSAGGARAKAIIAMNQDGKVISGQGTIPKDYAHWILKLDGVTDLELGEPAGYGLIEYAYYQMAHDAGIDMMESKLIQDDKRAHFATKRFDRQGNKKTHAQTLCGLAHYDYYDSGVYSYEQLFSIMRQLRLTQAEIVQQYRRMVFNIFARNQDDHTKNIGFLMSEQGKWSLSPAYDVTHSCGSEWTSRHQMTVMGKRDHFTYHDLIEAGHNIGIKKPNEIIEKVRDAVGCWEAYAKKLNMNPKVIEVIKNDHKERRDEIRKS